MIEFADRHFVRLIDRGGTMYRSMRFSACVFDFCSLSENRHPSERSRVKDVELVMCRTQNHTAVGPAVLENILVDGLETSGLLIAWGPLFRHVALRGLVGRIKINKVVCTEAFDRPSIQAPFDQTSAEFYRTVDWALDIL